MPMQVMADDSGCKGQGEHMLMAGLIGRAEAWATFADEWDACLRDSPSIPVFKMYDAAHRVGVFAGFSEFKRDAKLRSFAAVINKPDFSMLHLTVDLAAHQRSFLAVESERAKERKLPGIVRRTLAVSSNPYFYTYHAFMSAACFHLWDAGEREPFDFIVDEHPSVGTRTKEWYPIIRPLMPEPMLSIMPPDPITRTDEDFLPLQAADMVAWLQLNRNSKRGRRFNWLASHFSNVTQSPRSYHMGSKDFELLTFMTEAHRKQGIAALPMDSVVELARLQGAKNLPERQD